MVYILFEESLKGRGYRPEGGDASRVEQEDLDEHVDVEVGRVLSKGAQSIRPQNPNLREQHHHHLGD